MNLTPQDRKDIEKATSLIIKNCRAGYRKPLAQAMAYQQLEGMMICLRKVMHIDRNQPGGLDAESYSIEEALKKKIDLEI